MRPPRLLLPLASALVAAAQPTAAAGMNRVYLVPAVKECPGPATCPREFQSSYTFSTILLRTAATKYSRVGKPALSVDFRGVRDAAGAPANGTVKVRILSGRVSIPGFGTFPDGAPLTQVEPLSVTLANGNGKIAYEPPASPNGIVTNGGGVEILDPEGKLLAVTGSQSKP
jgi:hypothetical protein